MESKNFFFKKLFSVLLNEKAYHKIKSRKIILDIKRNRNHDYIKALSKLVPANSTINHVGANMGQCTGRFFRALPASCIYSFEPIDKNYTAIKRMIRQLKLNNVHVFKTGISDHEGEFEISIPIFKGVVISTQASLENREAFANKEVKIRKEVISIEKLTNFKSK